MVETRYRRMTRHNAHARGRESARSATHVGARTAGRKALVAQKLLCKPVFLLCNLPIKLCKVQEPPVARFVLWLCSSCIALCGFPAAGQRKSGPRSGREAARATARVLAEPGRGTNNTSTRPRPVPHPPGGSRPRIPAVSRVSGPSADHPGIPFCFQK